jgi:hypothetical protein
VRLRIVACEIFFRELCHLAARSPRKVDVEFLPKGLHDQGGAVMRERLQAAVDATDPGRHDAVALAYGLCNNGLVGLRSRALPLVLLRAHDCITAFLGSRARYARYFDERPGTYFETTGWLERGVDGGPYGLTRATSRSGRAPTSRRRAGSSAGSTAGPTACRARPAPSASTSRRSRRSTARTTRATSWRR